MCGKHILGNLHLRNLLYRSIARVQCLQTEDSIVFANMVETSQLSVQRGPICENIDSNSQGHTHVNYAHFARLINTTVNIFGNESV